MSSHRDFAGADKIGNANFWVPSPRRRYRKCMNGVRAQRHAYMDMLFQKKRKARK